ncbi:MAG: hypothetical protein R3C53_14870 [Pirellulaceae bacterium]
MAKTSITADQQVEMDRRRKDRRPAEATAVDGSNAQPTRRKKQRRRQIDPTTCERDYNGDEILFMQALDAYKRSSGRMFPTCSEILEVIRDLGYVKLNEDEKQILQSIEEVEAEIADATETDDVPQTDFETVD